MSFAPWPILGLAASALSGCMSVGPPAAGQTKTFVGVIRVKTPAVEGDMQVADVGGLGFGWDAGPWLGWRSGLWVTADPAKCQLLIIIRSSAQAQNAAQMLRALKGTQPCMVDSSQP